MRCFAAILLALLPALSAQISPDLYRQMAARAKPSNKAFSFAAIGDQQYGAEGEKKWPALAQSLNDAAKRLKFVVHVGDIKSGSSRCTNEMFADRLAAFNAIRMPFILTPGDNEWTDCHRASNGPYDPLERLTYLRQVFFSTDRSLGHPTIKLFQQSQGPKYALYRENALWTQGNLVFATIHMIGSNNNLGRNAENDKEYAPRNAANLEWMRTAFRLATENKFGGVVLVFQADPGFPLIADGKFTATAGFVDFLRVLEAETIRFAKPVLAIHGDSHYFRFDQPMVSSKDNRQLENFFRLEVPGEQDVHWVQVNVDPKQPDAPFVISYQPVRVNFLQHPLP